MDFDSFLFSFRPGASRNQIISGNINVIHYYRGENSLND